MQIDKSVRERILDLHQREFTPQEIAGELGCSLRTVYLTLRQSDQVEIDRSARPPHFDSPAAKPKFPSESDQHPNS
ncbi:MAG: helix-turn-helix domain-containing protein [Planctomycetales bacterium]|nr:helix-turn-helix domain-containing protein [Planctomycetales bacterium]